VVGRERLKYLTRQTFVESKRMLVQGRILKWQTSHDGTVYVMPRIPNASFSADNLLGLPSVTGWRLLPRGDDSRYRRLDTGNDARANPVVAGG
jgi:hypothetical protein